MIRRGLCLDLASQADDVTDKVCMPLRLWAANNVDERLSCIDAYPYGKAWQTLFTKHQVQGVVQQSPKG